MSTPCERFAERLGDDGLEAALASPELGEHYQGCADCRALATSLAALDQDLASLRPLDANDALTQSTLDRVRAVSLVATSEPAPEVRATRLRLPAWVGKPLGRAAAAFVLLVGVVVVMNLIGIDRRGSEPRSVVGFRDHATTSETYAPPPAAPAVRPSEADEETKEQSGGGVASIEATSESLVLDATESHSAAPMAAKPDGVYAKGAIEAEKQVVGGVAGGKDSGNRFRQDSREGGAEYVAAQQALRVQNDAVDLYSNQQVQGEGARDKKVKARLQAAQRDRDEANAELSNLRKNEASDAPARELGRVSAIADDRFAAPADFLDRSATLNGAGDSLGDGESLESRAITPALQFQEASGYWANTYVPGDPTIRLLETRLRGSERSPIIGADGRVLRLDSASRQYIQPFDVPENAALALYLHADRRGVSGPTRLLVQVGLQGTRRASGLRPAMNVGVVLDLTGGVSKEVSAGMRALLAALNKAKQTGDRFSLSVAGVPGGVIVPAEEFKHGTIAVVTRQLFGDEPLPAASTLDLAGAVAAATLAVSQSDDPNAQLGASAVLLVSGNAIAEPELTAVEDQAHAGAVGGIPLSVVAVGDGVDLEAIDRLTLAGQGNRRLLANAGEAESVIDRELHSASRVVARAVRLRVRLAPGVRLVEVIGSSKLDDGRTARVREAEVAVDRRLAKNLGIEADRGEDEEGIQMVIPAYYAGDAHIVLLDVVIDRPGPIADVTVRYKDLVFLRNGVAQTNLSLSSRRDEPGPLERNVLKNFIATRLSDAILRAGESLEEGEVEAADALLASQMQSLDQARQRIQGWENDAELQNDIAMIGEYRSALGANDTERQRVADSLRYAGYLKVQARRK